MMDPNPKSAKFKLGFTGTNCSGKTTTALEVTARLKAEHHYLAEVVSSQDRKITWKDDHFPVDPRAHFGMITNMIHAEVQAELKGDAKVVITDRSALDLYAIALTDHPDSPMIQALGHAVDAWSKTYTRIFYLPPLPYQEDGKRPADDFRMRTHATLMTLIESGRYPNVVMIQDRTEIMSKVRDALGLQSPNPRIIGEDEKWQCIANEFGVPLVVKQPKWASSDYDVWILFETVPPDTAPISEMIDAVIGDVPVHLMTCPLSAKIRIQAQHSCIKVYNPVEAK